MAAGPELGYLLIGLYLLLLVIGIWSLILWWKRKKIIYLVAGAILLLMWLVILLLNLTG
jgi:hypothetical protein